MLAEINYRGGCHGLQFYSLAFRRVIIMPEIQALRVYVRV